MVKVTLRYDYKEYPDAPSLTKISNFVGRTTTPTMAFLFAMIAVGLYEYANEGALEQSVFDNPLVGLIIFIAYIVVTQFIFRKIRKYMFKLLDKKYADMLTGKIPMN